MTPSVLSALCLSVVRTSENAEHSDGLPRREPLAGMDSWYQVDEAKGIERNHWGND